MTPLLLPSMLLWTFSIVLALVFGSFLNVCIARLPRHQSIVRPASHCPRCQAPVRPRDNVPVLGWLLLRGRCRDCGLPISVRYPLVELGYALLVAGSILRYSFSPEAVAAAAFCFLALGLMVMDAETMLLPDAFTLPGLVLGLLSATLAPRDGLDAGATRFADHLNLSAVRTATLSAAGAALLLLAIRWMYYALRRRHGLGAGDVKLVAMLGAWLGPERMAVCFLLAITSAALAGLATGLLGSARNQRGAWRTLKVPLGAFLCGAALFSLFYGREMFNWYMSFWP